MTDQGIDPVLLRGLQDALDPLVPRAAAVNRIIEKLRRANEATAPAHRMPIQLRPGPRIRTLMVAALTVAVVAGALVAGFGLRSRSLSPHHGPPPAPATATTRDTTTIGGYFDVNYSGEISGQTHQIASCRFLTSPGEAEVIVHGIGPNGAPIPTGPSGSSSPTGYAQVYLLYKNPPGMTDGTFSLHDSADWTALGRGVPQPSLVFSAGGVADVSFRGVSGTVTISGHGLDGHASASLVRQSVGGVAALPSAAAVLTWSCAPPPVAAIDPCTLMTSHEASVLTGAAMGPALYVAGSGGGGPLAALAGPQPYYCEFPGSKVNVAVEVYHGRNVADAQVYFDSLAPGHFGFSMQRLSGLGNSAAIAHVPINDGDDAIYVIDGSNVFDIVCYPSGCADSTLEAAATFALGRLP